MDGGREIITGYAEWARSRAGDKEVSADSTTPGKSRPNTHICEHAY
jgi:hypothetical protein